MPQTITLEDGTTQEVYTADELETQRLEAIEKYKEENPDKTPELTTAMAELEKFKGKDLNFANLRTQKEAAEKKVEEILKGVDERLLATEKRVLEGVMKDHYNETLKGLTDDEELKKKVELQFKRLGDVAGTKEEITNKLKDAYLLAVGPVEMNALNNTVISSGGVRSIKINNSDKKFTPEEKAFAQKLAQAGGMTLKDEDFK